MSHSTAHDTDGERSVLCGFGLEFSSFDFFTTIHFFQ